MLLYLNYPSWLHPEVIPGFAFLRWYSLMYLAAFVLTYILFRKLLKKEGVEMDPKVIESLFFSMIIGLLLGGRIFSTLVYYDTAKYWLAPWLIFWPFNAEMQFVGLEGMSYHGAIIGIPIGVFIFARRYHYSFWALSDRVVACASLAYTLGRLGNFANAELYGRATSVPWGMLFPNAERYPSYENWVIKIAQETNIPLNSAFINLPRHPSQLYEAFFEGVVLFFVLWFIALPRQKRGGSALALYLFGYGFFRFGIEYFREPDIQLLFPLRWGDPTAHFSYLNFTTGQILNALMMFIAGLMYLYLRKRNFSPHLEVLNQKASRHKHTSKNKHASNHTSKKR